MATITTREVGATAKNSPLTNAELDNNFINLNNEITELSAPASTSSAGLMSASDKTKLDSVAAGAQVNAVDSVAGKTGAVTLVKADVGLGSVDNTSDSAKAVLSATRLATARTIGGVSFDGSANINLPGVNIAGNQNTTGNAATATKLATARTINGVNFDGTANITVTDTTKEPAITAGTTSQYWRGDKTWSDFATTVRTTVLTGLSTATNAVITATDTVLTMAGKLQKQISDHFASTANAHPASAIALANPTAILPGSLAAGTVQQRMEEIFLANNSVAMELVRHQSEVSTQHPASVISNVPSGNIAATNVQAAINELDSTKLPLTGGGITGRLGIGTNSPRVSLEVAGAVILGRTDTFLKGGEIAFARSLDNTVAYTLDANGAIATPDLRLLNVAKGNTVSLFVNGANNNIGFSTTATNAKLQLDNAVDTNGYDVRKIRLYENGTAICGFGVSGAQLNYRTIGSHVFYNGQTEAARIDPAGSLIFGQKLRTGHFLSLNSLASSTNWLRLCSFDSGNLPRYVRFLLSSSAHDNWLVEFSPGAGGDNIRAKITLLGFFGYYNQYPLQWRICQEGTNLPCHLDIKFGGSHSIPYLITVLESFASSVSMATFPCTDVGTSVNGGAGATWGVQFGTSSGLSYREAELVPGAFARISTNLTRSNGTLANNTIAT